MNLELYSIYDSVAKSFQPPFACRNKGEAIRMFTVAAEKSETMVGKYPSEHKMLLIGHFDADTGVITSCLHEDLGFANQYISSNSKGAGLQVARPATA